MIDLMDGLITGGFGAVSYLLGRRTRKTQVSEFPNPVKDPKPICQCSHGWAMHGEDGACGVIFTETVLVERGNPRTVGAGAYGQTYKIVYDHEKWDSHERKCGCKRYTGPEPMPTMVAL